MEENHAKNNRKRKCLFAVMVGIIVLLLCVVAVMSVGLVKLSQQNRYSKNIILGNNYFLSTFGEKTEQPNESPRELPQEMGEQEMDAAYSEIMVADQITGFDWQLFDMRENGLLDDETYSAIYEKAQKDGVADAASYANEILGCDYFCAADYGKKLEVPYLSQVGILPNGCETVSAVMLLHYYGFSVDPVDFCDTYLDKGEVNVKWGCRYGPNPKEQYAGDPKSEKGGWGCFAPVIIKALNQYLKGQDCYAKNLTGLTLEEIVQQYIVQDIPAAVWCTQGMEEIDSLYQWQSYDKRETFLYPVHEHCVVLTGFDSEYYYFNDPLNEEKTVRYEKSVASESFNSLGRQAVAVIKK